MDAKQIARYLGALSIEERVLIIKCLLDAGPNGLQMLDIAAATELGAAGVFKQLESLAGLEMVLVKSVDNSKFYIANTRQLNEVFEWMYHHYGPGFHAKPEEQGTTQEAQAQS